MVSQVTQEVGSGLVGLYYFNFTGIQPEILEPDRCWHKFTRQSLHAYE